MAWTPSKALSVQSSLGPLHIWLSLLLCVQKTVSISSPNAFLPLGSVVCKGRVVSHSSFFPWHCLIGK